jgi:hypothetical protein
LDRFVGRSALQPEAHASRSRSIRLSGKAVDQAAPEESNAPAGTGGVAKERLGGVHTICPDGHTIRLPPLTWGTVQPPCRRWGPRRSAGGLVAGVARVSFR